jgi:hypothetical protein
VLRCGLLDDVPLHQAVALHVTQCLGQYLLGYTGHPAAQLRMPLRTGQQCVDGQGKLADLRAAVGVLAGGVLPSGVQVDADRIAVVGSCLGGGYAYRSALATFPVPIAVIMRSARTGRTGGLRISHSG